MNGFHFRIANTRSNVEYRSVRHLPQIPKPFLLEHWIEKTLREKVRLPRASVIEVLMLIL